MPCNRRRTLCSITSGASSIETGYGPCLVLGVEDGRSDDTACARSAERHEEALDDAHDHRHDTPSSRSRTRTAARTDPSRYESPSEAKETSAAMPVPGTVAGSSKSVKALPLTASSI